MKEKKRTIRHYCVIVIAIISMIAFINTIEVIQVYTKQIENIMIENFTEKCEEEIERRVDIYEKME